uniref:Uncharacterized protein n=1 Tax=Oryza rufipogon TaxID=4529 RepID=A0A0E0N020_ORYRU
MREKGKDEGKVRGKGPTAEEGRAKGATGGADVSAGADTRGEVAGDSTARVIGQRRCGRAVKAARQTVGARKQLSAGRGSSRCRRLGNGARKRWSEPMPGRRGWRSGGGEEAVVGTNSGAMKLWAALVVGSGLALSSTSRSLVCFYLSSLHLHYSTLHATDPARGGSSVRTQDALLSMSLPPFSPFSQLGSAGCRGLRASRFRALVSPG